MRDKKLLDLSPFIGLCGVLLISLVLENLIYALYPAGKPVDCLHPTSPVTVEDMGMESRFRLSYRTSCFMVLLIEVIVAAVFWYIITYNFRIIKQAQRLRVWLIAFFAPAILIGLIGINGGKVHFLSSELNTSFIPYSSMITSNYIYANAERIVNVISVLAIFFTFIMCGAYVALLYRSRLATKLEEFIEINNQLKWVLICGSLLLAAGVFNVKSLYNWALQYHLFLGPNPLASALADSASIQTGVVFSMIITILYLPSYFVVQFRLNKLIEKMKSENLIPIDKPVNDVLKENELTSSTVEIFSRIILLLAPALSGGPIQSILEL